MLKIEKTSVYGFMEAIRGMRNPMESHDKTDSKDVFVFDTKGFYMSQSEELSKVCVRANTKEGYSAEYVPFLGPNDMELMRRLITAGTEHSKFMRMIVVYCDITAPLYWWKEFDTYKIGTVANSYSTMHKIHAHEFTIDMFSHEHLLSIGEPGWEVNTDVSIRSKENQNNYDAALLACSPIDVLNITIDTLNTYRKRYLRTRESSPEEAKRYWWQMIQLLPSSYNQTRTVMSNYSVLENIFKQRKNHKQDEWRIDFMKWIDTLPYAELIKLSSKQKGGK